MIRLMRNIFITALFVLFAISCGGGSGGTAPGDSPGGSSGTVALTGVADGATSVATHTPFTATFSESMTASTITDSTFYIVASSSGSESLPLLDTSVCNSTNKLEASVECTSDDDITTTSCTLNPQAFLDGETGYTICLDSSITHATGSAFAGASVTFTTAAATVNSSSCGDTDVQVFEVVQSIPFDIANVRRISRYRSCIGHSMNDEFEPTPYSSMKHYVYGPAGHANCYEAKVYAPFDGTVVGAVADTDVTNDAQHVAAGCDESASSAYIAIQSADYPRYAVNLEHVNPVAGIETGVTVTAGQEIGYGVFPTPENGSWDVVFGTVDITNDLYIDSESGLSLYSYCTIAEFLSDSAEATLVEYGVDNLSELKFTKTERQADECTGTMGGDGVPDDQMGFDAKYNDDLNHWVNFE